MKRFLVLLQLFLPLLSFAKVELAFIEIRTPAGNLVQLEPGGRFAHIAIAYGDKWLHAYPARGVEIVTLAELERIGKVADRITLPKVPDLTEAKIAPYLGKPYDWRYSWTNDKIYCSELVAKLIGMEPTPMNYDGPAWNDRPNPGNAGELGISPDDIYWRLRPRQQ